MRLLCEYEHDIRAQFSHLTLPSEGITIPWLNGIKALRHLIDEATRDYGVAVPFLISSLVCDLRGSALFAWRMADSLMEVSDAVGRIETHMREFDLAVSVLPVMPPARYQRRLN